MSSHLKLTSDRGLLADRKSTTFVFSWLIVRRQRRHQRSRISSSLWRSLSVSAIKTISSAYIKIPNVKSSICTPGPQFRISFAKSLMYNEYNVGDKLHPCFTPECIGKVSMKVLLMRTVHLMSWYSDCKAERILPRTPIRCNLYQSRSLFTVSDAFFSSTKQPNVDFRENLRLFMIV